MAAKSSGGFKARLEAARAKNAWVDHVLSMNEHYGNIQGNVLAGAVTYFGFLSFFPILAIAFAVVGYVSATFPDARENLVTAIEQLFPGIVSDTGDPGTISLQQIESASATAGIIGFITLLYTGLGWVSGLRLALETAFEVPKPDKRRFVVGKAIDLGALAAIGVFMIISVGIAGTIRAAAGDILEIVGIDDTALGEPLLWALGVALGLLASTVLFYAIYRILGHPSVPRRTLWQGALLGATGFELLKLLVVYVIGSVGGSAFAPLAIAVTLAVWINYFSRLIVYGAAWAMTSPLTSSSVHRASDTSEAAVVARDHADRAGVLVSTGEPAIHASAGTGMSGGRFDPGSAVIGAIAGFLASVILRRPS